MKKTKEELLKIYSAYLPYELKTDKGLLWAICKDFLVKTKLNDGEIVKGEIDKLKPILYSMDMLTKEIEHKGERFVPSLEIAKQTITGGNYNWYAVKKENLRYLNYEVIDKLLEWHFNVFGLDESEYIKKESLNRSENPNS